MSSGDGFKNTAMDEHARGASAHDLEELVVWKVKEADRLRPAVLVLNH